jgi:hypothetical protein
MKTEKIKILFVILGAIIITGLLYYYSKQNNESFADISSENYQYPEDNIDMENNQQNTFCETQKINNLNAPKASEPLHNNEIYTSISNLNMDEETQNNQFPNDSYPKDQLTPSELLPGDANSTWAQVNPAGQGSLGDQNFLNAGHHVGTNTVGQTLRNANLQLRSEPPNPQVKVSPWLQSTIEPDTNRKALEIG